MSIGDLEYKALVQSGFTGTIDDMRKKYFTVMSQPGRSMVVGGGVTFGGLVNVALFGDSNTAEMNNAGATTFETRSSGYGSWIAPRSFQRAQVSWNSASGGQKVVPIGADANPLSKQIDDFLASPVAASTGAAFVMMGTNDVVTAPAVVASALLAQLQRLRPRRVLLATIPPARGATNTSTATYQPAGTARWQWVLRYNALIRQIARDNPAWITLIDVHGIGVDPASETAEARAGYIYTETEPNPMLHLGNVYAERVGGAIADALCKPLPDQFDWLTSAADLSTLTASATEPATQVLSNGLFTAGAAPGTGWATSVGGNASRTDSIILNPNGFGSALQQAATFSTGLSDFVRASNSGWNSRVSNGDRIFGQCWVRLPAGIVGAPRLYVSLNVGGSLYSVAALARETSKTTGPLPARDLLIRTPILNVPASGAITSADFQLTHFGGGVEASGNIIVGQAEVRRIVGVA